MLSRSLLGQAFRCRKVFLEDRDCRLSQLRSLRVAGFCLSFVLGDALFVVADQRIEERFVKRRSAYLLKRRQLLTAALGWFTRNRNIRALRKID